MIDGERRGYQAGAEAVSTLPYVPTDEELGRLAATAWTEYLSRGYAHIEPREAFLHGYAMAVRHLLSLFDQ